MPLIEHTFNNANTLNSEFASEIVAKLKAAIATNGRASIAVSGGSTPKPLFQILSKDETLDWSKVTVLLVDERWVDDSSDASNQTLVKQNLLQWAASQANYVSIKTNAENAVDAVNEINQRLSSVLPIDIIILGMGADGHTASLFPCSKELAEGLDLSNNNAVIATQPTTAPHQRMSLTLASIISANSIYLHITGDEKRAVLTDALKNATPMEKPILAVAENADLHLMWAP
ncbi:6-phosphogluconolactonase [Glaciecola sp. 1036]|uniref:6-phosphogluconolactonase n=1 Tax=Alteromonadaceae TaxID=72275 RepID=UPI003D050D63